MVTVSWNHGHYLKSLWAVNGQSSAAGALRRPVKEKERSERAEGTEESALETRQHYTDSTTRQTNSEPRLIFRFLLRNMIKWPMFSFYKLISFKCFHFNCIVVMYKVKKNTFVLKVNLAYR